MTAVLVIHVVISLFAIIAGLVVLASWLEGRILNRWTDLFLSTTVATSLTGFLFPFDRLLPSHVLAILSLLVLAPATYAFYAVPLRGVWKRVFVSTSLMALYFNVFVLIVQSFQKVSGLKALAPTQTEMPFVATQVLTLAAFVVLGFFADRNVRNIDLQPVAGRNQRNVSRVSG